MTSVTDNYAPKFPVHPANGTANMGCSFTFGATVIALPAPTLQWQVSTNGTTWTNISGATNNTYTATFGMADSGKRYRLTATNSVGTANSNAATLTVVPYYDLDGLAGIDVRDLLLFMSVHGSTNPANIAIADFNGDGVINDADLALLLDQF
jgi:hypothetical protein